MLKNAHTVWTNLLLSLRLKILKQVAKGHGQIYLGFSEDLRYIEALLYGDSVLLLDKDRVLKIRDKLYKIGYYNRQGWGYDR